MGIYAAYLRCGNRQTLDNASRISKGFGTIIIACNIDLAGTRLFQDSKLEGELVMLTQGRLCLDYMKAKLGQRKDQSGQGMVEYVLIIALIAIAVIAFLPGVAGGITSVLTNITNHLTGGGS
jgi:pilus assembly protein Flp/PilA